MFSFCHLAIKPTKHGRGAAMGGMDLRTDRGLEVYSRFGADVWVPYDI